MTLRLDVPRLVIAAPQGRSGKTTVSLGLCAAFAARGLAVHPFKKGPDYIDPSWLSAAAGRPCRNLDPFFMPDRDSLLAAFGRAFRAPRVGGAFPADAPLALIEGNHGLYDSLDDDGAGSTAALARTLGAPVLLVVNTARMGRSAAALVGGYLAFEPETPIRGVILNNVARGRHEDKVRQAIERHCGIPVLGALPRDEALTIPDRHLGLVPQGEDPGLAALQACRERAELYCDLDAILALAGTAAALPREVTVGLTPVFSGPRRGNRIAVFRDRAFSFYYYENLEALEDAGAELGFVDSFSAEGLPPCDLLYIGGGFPEIFMDELAANSPLLRSVRSAAMGGLPVYAECGGLMYLARRLYCDDRSVEMAGVLPIDVEMTGSPQGHGYVDAAVDAANPFFRPGTRLRGHEFHNSRLVPPSGLPTAYALQRGRGTGEGRDGLVLHNVLASYTHLHTAGAPGWAAALAGRL